MAFTLAGTTITQTGTDTNLSGLNGIAGVAFTTRTTGGIDYRIADIGTHKLVIGGILTQNALTDKLVLGNRVIARQATDANMDYIIRVQNGGTWNVTSQATRNSNIVPLKAVFVDSYLNDADYDAMVIRVDNGGTINWSNGIFKTEKGGIVTAPTASVTIDNCFLHVINPNIITSNNNSQFRLSTHNASITNCVFGTLTPTFKTRSDQLNFADNIIYGNRWAVDGSGDNGTPTANNTQFVILNGYSHDNSNQYTQRGWGVATWYKNNKNGLVDFKIDTTQTAHWGFSKFTKDFKIVTKGTSGVDTISQVFIADYDNGNRKNFTETRAPAGVIRKDYRPTNNYIFNSGVQVEIVLAYFLKYYGQNVFTTDYRSKNGNNTDIFDVIIWNYNKLPAVFPYAMKGQGLAEIEWTLFNDPNITQADQTIVAGYTGIAINHTTKIITISEDIDIDKLVDYIKYDKTQNIIYPTPSTIITTISGDSVDIADYSLTFSTNGILNSSTKFNKVISTGTLTIIDNSNINCYLEFSNFISIQVDGLKQGARFRIVQTLNAVLSEVLDQYITTAGSSWFSVANTTGASYSIQHEPIKETPYRVSQSITDLKARAGRSIVLINNIDALVAQATQATIDKIKASGVRIVNDELILDAGQELLSLDKKETITMLHYLNQQDEDKWFTDIGVWDNITIEFKFKIPTATVITFAEWESITLPTAQDEPKALTLGVPVKIGSKVVTIFDFDQACNFIIKRADDTLIIKANTQNYSQFFDENEVLELSYGKEKFIPKYVSQNIGGGLTIRNTLEAHTKASTATLSTAISVDAVISHTNNKTIIEVPNGNFSRQDFIDFFLYILGHTSHLQTILSNQNSNILIIGDNGSITNFINLTSKGDYNVYMPYYFASSDNLDDIYTSNTDHKKVIVNIEPQVFVLPDGLRVNANIEAVAPNLQFPIDNNAVVDTLLNTTAGKQSDNATDVAVGSYGDKINNNTGGGGGAGLTDDEKANLALIPGINNQTTKMVFDVNNKLAVQANGDTKEDIYTYFIGNNRADIFKANLAALTNSLANGVVLADTEATLITNAVWNATTRELTNTAGLTTAQATTLGAIKTLLDLNLDDKVSNVILEGQKGVEVLALTSGV